MSTALRSRESPSSRDAEEPQVVVDVPWDSFDEQSTPSFPCYTASLAEALFRTLWPPFVDIGDSHHDFVRPLRAGKPHYGLYEFLEV